MSETIPEPRFKIGDNVWKESPTYSGPGIVEAVVPPSGRIPKTLYLVSAVIAGGEGRFLHIYTEAMLRPLEMKDVIHA